MRSRKTDDGRGFWRAIGCLIYALVVALPVHMAMVYVVDTRKVLRWFVGLPTGALERPRYRVEDLNDRVVQRLHELRFPACHCHAARSKFERTMRELR